MLQHTATHCNILYDTTTRCNTVQHSATQCNTVQHALQHTAAHYNTLPHNATQYQTLQHTVTNSHVSWRQDSSVYRSVHMNQSCLFLTCTYISSVYTSRDSYIQIIYTYIYTDESYTTHVCRWYIQIYTQMSRVTTHIYKWYTRVHDSYVQMIYTDIYTDESYTTHIYRWYTWVHDSYIQMIYTDMYTDESCHDSYIQMIFTDIYTDESCHDSYIQMIYTDIYTDESCLLSHVSFLLLLYFLNRMFDVFHPLLPFVSPLLSPRVRAPSLLLFRPSLFSLPPSFFLSRHLPTLLLECNVPLHCCSVLQCVAVCCSVLQCIAVHCSALQCIATCLYKCTRVLRVFALSRSLALSHCISLQQLHWATMAHIFPKKSMKPLFVCNLTSRFWNTECSVLKYKFKTYPHFFVLRFLMGLLKLSLANKYVVSVIVLGTHVVCVSAHEIRLSHLVVKSLTHGSWSGNIVNRKPPREGGLLLINSHTHKHTQLGCLVILKWYTRTHTHTHTQLWFYKWYTRIHTHTHT